MAAGPVSGGWFVRRLRLAPLVAILGGVQGYVWDAEPVKRTAVARSGGQTVPVAERRP